MARTDLLRRGLRARRRERRRMQLRTGWAAPPAAAAGRILLPSRTGLLELVLLLRLPPPPPPLLRPPERTHLRKDDLPRHQQLLRQRQRQRQRLRTRLRCPSGLSNRKGRGSSDLGLRTDPRREQLREDGSEFAAATAPVTRRWYILGNSLAQLSCEECLSEGRPGSAMTAREGVSGAMSRATRGSADIVVASNNAY